MQFYEKAARAMPDNRLYQIRLGVAYVRLRQYAEAHRVFDAERAKYPDDSNIVYLQGYLARAEGDYDRAIEAFEKALKGMPDNPDVLANLGFLAYQRGDDEKAEHLLKETIKIDPANLSAHYDLGRLLMRSRRIAEALPILEKGTEIGRDDPGVFYQLFLAYTRLNKKEKAQAALAEFKRLEALTRPTSGSAIARESTEVPASVTPEKP